MAEYDLFNAGKIAGTLGRKGEILAEITGRRWGPETHDFALFGASGRL